MKDTSYMRLRQLLCKQLFLAPDKEIQWTRFYMCIVVWLVQWTKKSVYRTWGRIHCVFDVNLKACYECQASNSALADVLSYKDSFGLNYRQEQEKYKG